MSERKAIGNPFSVPETLPRVSFFDITLLGGDNTQIIKHAVLEKTANTHIYQHVNNINEAQSLDDMYQRCQKLLGMRSRDFNSMEGFMDDLRVELAMGTDLSQDQVDCLKEQLLAIEYVYQYIGQIEKNAEKFSNEGKNFIKDNTKKVIGKRKDIEGAKDSLKELAKDKISRIDQKGREIKHYMNHWKKRSR